MGSAAFPKREHICSTRLIDELFGSGSQSMAAFPLRAVFRMADRPKAGVPVQVLISVPKKRLKHAVDRNRVKRQVREAYRHARQQLVNAVPEGQSLLLAFVWMSDRLSPSPLVAGRVEKLLKRIAEKI